MGEAIFDDLADGVTGNLVPSPDVLRFREELLARWPDLKDELEPSDFDLADSPDDALKYVLLTLSIRPLDHPPEVLA